MDQFKKYLRDHRSDLDVEVPPAGLWEKKPVNRTVKLNPRKWMAAASIFLIISSIFYWMSGELHSDKTVQHKPAWIDSTAKRARIDSLNNEKHIAEDYPVSSNSAEPKNEIITSQKNVIVKRRESSSKFKDKNAVQTSPLQTLENNYASIIAYQLKRVERTPIYAESADYFHVFKKQWYDLERDEEKIKRDISLVGLNDIIVDQFIQLYQNKIELLKQLQSQIDKMNLRARHHPELHKQIPTYLKM